MAGARHLRQRQWDSSPLQDRPAQRQLFQGSGQEGPEGAGGPIRHTRRRIGTGVSSAAQLDRLPGTWNRKGPHTAERPHRRATIVSVPDTIEVVPIELLEALAGPAQAAPELPTATDRQGANPVSRPPDGFTLTATADDRARRYAEAARDKEYARLALAPEGNRNNALNGAAFVLGQFIGAGLLERDETGEQLLQIATRIGLDESEARPTLKSGIEAGVAQPRNVPAPEVVEVGDDWPEPFLDCQPPATPFPLEVLPGSLRDLCTACAEAYVCPVDFFAVPSVVLAGGVIGQSVNLRINNTWRVPPHLFCLIIGPPGSKKTPALDKISEPIREIDRELYEEYLAAKAELLPRGSHPVPATPRAGRRDPGGRRDNSFGEPQERDPHQR